MPDWTGADGHLLSCDLAEVVPPAYTSVPVIMYVSQCTPSLTYVADAATVTSATVSCVMMTMMMMMLISIYARHHAPDKEMQARV